MRNSLRADGSTRWDAEARSGSASSPIGSTRFSVTASGSTMVVSATGAASATDSEACSAIAAGSSSAVSNVILLDRSGDLDRLRRSNRNFCFLSSAAIAGDSLSRQQAATVPLNRGLISVDGLKLV